MCPPQAFRGLKKMLTSQVKKAATVIYSCFLLILFAVVGYKFVTQTFFNQKDKEVVALSKSDLQAWITSSGLNIVNVEEFDRGGNYFLYFTYQDNEENHLILEQKIIKNGFKQQTSTNGFGKLVNTGIFCNHNQEISFSSAGNDSQTKLKWIYSPDKNSLCSE